MKDWIVQWKNDRLWGTLVIFWLATVAASFWGAYLLPIPIPGVGTIYAFRILLVITTVVYLFWSIKRRQFFWEDNTAIDRWCYVLIFIMLVYGLASLPRALDFIHTFRKLFNLCFDLCFFFLMLHICRKERMFRATMWVSLGSVAIMCALGIYEVFCGGIFTTLGNDYLIFPFFNIDGQFPMVTSSNTNDYCASLMFVVTIILFMVIRRKHKRWWELLICCISLPVLFLLLTAATAALNLIGLMIIYCGMFIYFAVANRKQLWIPIISLMLVLGVSFANQYRYIVPPIQQYLMQLQEYRNSDDVLPDTQLPDKPVLSIGKPNTGTLKDEFFVFNDETQALELREEGSGGIRAHLLIHAFRCFRESYGIGVGLGNTEILTKEYHVIQDGRAWAIHCFIARIIADFGVFVLIPLCAIAYLLLKKVCQQIYFATRKKDFHAVGVAIFFFCVFCTYPFVSTSSSDAQDIIAMWIYLASVVYFANSMLPIRGEEKT